MNRLGEKWSSGFFSSGGADDSGLVVALPVAPPDPERDDEDDGLAVLLLSAPLNSGAAVVPSAAEVGLGVVVGSAVGAAVAGGTVTRDARESRPPRL